VGVATVWFPPDASQLPFSPEDVVKIKAAVGFKPLWREDQRADMWVGKAVARVMGLNHKGDRERVKMLLDGLYAIKALTLMPVEEQVHDRGEIPSPLTC
jgi:hypothetical protein